MAKDKKSFLLYCDLIHTVSKMPLEKAGELFLHILKYVNDENPVNEDLIVSLTFEPIKQSLKRDLEKYEAVRTKNINNINKRWNKKDTNHIENIPNDTTVYDRIQVDTKNTVSVSDSVNVSVSDNDISLKEKGEKILIPITAGKFSQFNIQDAPPKILQDAFEAWVYSTDVELRKKITIAHVKDKWQQFYATNKDSIQWYNSENEIYTHFKRWITKQKFINGNAATKNTGTKLGTSDARIDAIAKW